MCGKVMKCITIFSLLVLFLGLFSSNLLLAEKKPHAVFVVGTPHYNPGQSMPQLAKEMEAFGFDTTVVSAPGNPERNKMGIPGLEKLKSADVAIFYLRFLTLPKDQLKHVTDYLESGKPVVGFRTSTHAFAYPKSSPEAKWNDGFGREALGSKYYIHLQGQTEVSIAKSAAKHPILNGFDTSKPVTASGTLYLVQPPKDATILLNGTGHSRKVGKATNAFGTHNLQKTMTEEVAWVWENKWGGRVFYTSIGHIGSFSDPNFVRLFVNGIHWAAGKTVPQKANIQGLANSGKPKVQNVASKSKPSPPPSKNSKEFEPFNIDARTAPRPVQAKPIATHLPLEFTKGERIAFIGNTLLERAGDHGHLEALIHQAHPDKELVMRNLAWSADELDLQPRPDNFASTEQHLAWMNADLIFAAFGFNESFAGEAGLPQFRVKLTQYIDKLRAQAFNGKSAPRIVLISPIPNENVEGVDAANLNNPNLAAYTKVMKEVAATMNVGFVDAFNPLKEAMESPGTDLTFNGIHLEASGYEVFAEKVFQQLFKKAPPKLDESVRQAVTEKNKQFFRRFRPVNTFYYTGGRRGRYGYLDFLPAMRNFDILTANRDSRIHSIASGHQVPSVIDDSNAPPLPETSQGRGANQFLKPSDELKAFNVDPRFEVNIFASEDDFPELACPIQMRWDSKGRLWVSCSTTYPHVYPGNEPNDKMVILEDTDGDGRADKSTVWADDLHIPLSFEFGDGGVYVSEEPDMTFLKDTDGDGKADFRRKVLSGFGCEDSHHALHDFTWTPDGDLIFRESIFHHSQVETPYGPVRQRNSGWFRYEPKTHRLTSFGTYHSTNPWGVTFDDWGNHMASHPIFAEAFHALDPAYPDQHPKPSGLRAYSGTCGQEFIDFPNWPKDLQGSFIKVRYKPTNRVEIHKWVESEFGYDESYQGDLIFSKNLSFIPVDLRYGPDGGMYVCDWYNPIKGHAQYSLRDKRRDRIAGRIFRILPKGAKPQKAPRFHGASISELLEILKRPEYRYRYWAKRELREKDPVELRAALDKWVANLDSADSRYRHHQLEALWAYRNIKSANYELLEELLACDNHHARAAATKQLRYLFAGLPREKSSQLLRKAANDKNGLVRMEAAIATSYVGTPTALSALLDTLGHPHEKHLSYAIRTSLGSKKIKPLWQDNEQISQSRPELAKFMGGFTRNQKLQPPGTAAQHSQFDSQKNLKRIRISCLRERMLFDVTRFEVKPGQPVRLDFINPDATAHNLVIVQPGALEEVGLAANEMAKDPASVKEGQFLPKSSKVLFHTNMLKPDSAESLRFTAPKKPGEYPYLCTFPGHWVIMRGVMVVK